MAISLGPADHLRTGNLRPAEYLGAEVANFERIYTGITKTTERSIGYLASMAEVLEALGLHSKKNDAEKAKNYLREALLLLPSCYNPPRNRFYRTAPHDECLRLINEASRALRDLRSFPPAPKVIARAAIAIEVDDFGFLSRGLRKFRQKAQAAPKSGSIAARAAK